MEAHRNGNYVLPESEAIEAWKESLKMEVFIPSLESIRGRPITSFFTSCADPTLIFVQLWEYLALNKKSVPTVDKDLWHMRF
jgi:hypothetical protein